MEALKAVIRKDLGSHQTRKVRAAGLVPGIIYGHGLEPVPFALSAKDLFRLIKNGERVVEMDLDGKTEHYLVRAVQYDAFGDKAIHVDFARVRLDETVTVTVPIVLRGTPAGATEGGTLIPGLGQVEVECLVIKIPDEIRVRLNELKVGEFIRVKDLPPMEGVTILADPETMIAGCQMLAEEAAPAPVEGEEAVAPEIIGKGKKEEGEEGEAAAKA